MKEKLTSRRSVLSGLGIASLSLVGMSTAAQKPKVNGADFDPNNLHEIHRFWRALMKKYGKPDERSERIAIIESLNEEQRIAYYDATDVHWIQRQQYSIRPNPESHGTREVQFNNISVERVNEELTDRWDWDMSDSKPAKTELVDLDQKTRTLSSSDNFSTDGSVSATSTVGESVTATNSLTQVYEFSYEVTWDYSYYVDTQFGEPIYTSESVDDVGPHDIDGEATEVDWSYHGSTQDSNESAESFTSWAEGKFEHARVDGIKTYNPYIKLGGDARGNGEVIESDNGK